MEAAPVVQRGERGEPALARQHQVDPKTIRRVLDAAGARELPEQLDVLPDPAA
ncbi:hypothetical protein [Streptomyces sp. NPDC055400]